MSIEDGSKEDANYQEIAKDIEDKGYYSLPAGSVIDIKITTGRPIEVPILDINNIPTENISKNYDDIDTKQLNQFQIKQELMLGGVESHHFITGETEFTLTSPELIESEKRRNEWYANLVKKYGISDDYIDEEHEEKNTGLVDISLYTRDHPEVAEEILNEERSLKEESNRLKNEAEMKFIKTTGISIAEDKTLLRVSAFMKTK